MARFNCYIISAKVASFALLDSWQRTINNSILGVGRRFGQGAVSSTRLKSSEPNGNLYYLEFQTSMSFDSNSSSEVNVRTALRALPHTISVEVTATGGGVYGTGTGTFGTGTGGIRTGAITPQQTRTGAGTLGTRNAGIIGGLIENLNAGDSGGESSYTVKRGDSISKIAKKYGMTVAALIALNSRKYPTLLTNPNLINVGWVLAVSGSPAGDSPSGGTPDGGTPDGKTPDGGGVFDKLTEAVGTTGLIVGGLAIVGVIIIATKPSK